MERRDFLRSMLGIAAATALPSEVWPFRRIFLPPSRKIVVIQENFSIFEPFVQPLTDFYAAETSEIYKWVKGNVHFHSAGR